MMLIHLLSSSIVMYSPLKVPLFISVANLFGVLFPVIFMLIFMIVWISRILKNRTKLHVENHNLRVRLIQCEDEINGLNTEKDWLVEELHHRVKNNLQMVISLLNTQAVYLENDEAKRVLRKSRHRLFALSLAHQKLYQGFDLSAIDIPQYLAELVEYLNDEYNLENQISFAIKTVPLNLHVNMAIPLGLITNEAVSNALKYAFPDNRPGHVLITLSRPGNGFYRLEIADNGIGGDNLVKQQNGSSLGKSLMKGLSDQMHAVLEIEDTEGILVRIDFPVSELQSCA